MLYIIITLTLLYITYKSTPIERYKVIKTAKRYEKNHKKKLVYSNVAQKDLHEYRNELSKFHETLKEHVFTGSIQWKFYKMIQDVNDKCERRLSYHRNRINV